MEPRLVAVAGPKQGETFSIPENEVVIGRESEWLALTDPSASRRHCAIDHTEKGFRLRDLDSRNGTFVNRHPIQERILQDGDCIEIGNSMFLFLSQEQGAGFAEPPILHDSQAFVRSTIRARIEDILQMRPDEFQISPFPPSRIARALRVFWKIGNFLGTVKDIKALCENLLESIFELVPADSGAILLERPSSNQFSELFSLPDKELRPEALNRAIAMQVLRDAVGVIADDATESGAGNSSVLCVPLVVLNQPIGVLYLKASDPGARFSEDQLRLVAAIGGIAGAAIENCRKIQDLENENRLLRSDLQHAMIGESAAMKDVYEFIARTAPTDSTVLICGETGTGKELVAHAIHQNSLRSSHPFVAINCASLSETLLESELFGHERGAFTGAVTQKKGKLEIAHRGTVFLDEVAEISPNLQAKLLRFLQDHKVERVGGTHPIQVDIRLIAATNRDLEKAVAEGAFRQDFFYRLNVLTLNMPPLRNRVEDIPLLAWYFAESYSKKAKRAAAKISSEALRCLIGYSWPGNVRELENAIERAIVLGTQPVIAVDDLPERIIESQPPDVPITSYHQNVKQAKRQLILKALEQSNGNHSEAAKLLGLHPNNLHRLIRDLDLKSTKRNIK
jgi:two-component system, NtrC family, response regulator HydG